MITQILSQAIKAGASDVIISPGNHPAMKKSGEIVYLTDYDILTNKSIQEEVFSIIPEHMQQSLKDDLELDFSIALTWHGRLRVNAFKQRSGFGLVFRTIPEEIPEFDTLWIPEIIKSFSDRKSGLVLVTGGVGSGKSTTLAALINEINKNHKKHIITIEDPIEFVHTSKESLIEQREVGESTLSFENGLKYALRQASDVIMVGEMRDLDTFRLALRAAETGNLVFATLHTSGAARTVSRIIDMFPGDEKDHIRAQLAESLLWVVWQDLIKVGEGKRIPATEVMIKNKAIENMIRENHVHQIDGAIETGKAEGMIPMKRYLAELRDTEQITQEIYEKYMARYGLLQKTED